MAAAHLLLYRFTGTSMHQVKSLSKSNQCCMTELRHGSLSACAALKAKDEIDAVDQQEQHVVLHLLAHHRAAL